MISKFGIVAVPTIAIGALLTLTAPANAAPDPNDPGVVSGNNLQVPVHVPVNACGNSINIVGLLNPTFGNTCVND